MYFKEAVKLADPQDPMEFVNKTADPDYVVLVHVRTYAEALLDDLQPGSFLSLEFTGLTGPSDQAVFGTISEEGLALVGMSDPQLNDED